MSAAERLRKYSNKVASQLEPRYFVDELYAKNILSEEDKDKLKSLKGRLKKARTLLEIMETKGEQKIEAFFLVLKTTPEDKQPHLYKLFFPEAEQHGATGQTGTPSSTATVAEENQTVDANREETKKQLRDQEKGNTMSESQLPASSLWSKEKREPRARPRRMAAPVSESRNRTSEGEGSSEEETRPAGQHGNSSTSENRQTQPWNSWRTMQISVFGCSILLVALILGYMHGTGKPATEVLNKSQGDGERVAPTPSKNTKTLGPSIQQPVTAEQPVTAGQPATEGTDSQVEMAAHVTPKQGQTKEFRILAVSTGWSSTKGGIQTFNRAMCKALAQDERVRVACMLTEFTKEEYDDAQRSNVQLFLKKDKASTLSKLKPNILIGHGIPQLAEQMQFLEELLVANKIKHKTVLILHVYPFLLEPNKQTEGAASEADAKESELLRQAQTADVVAAVGPRLARYWASRLSKSLVQLNPGLYHDDVQVKNRPQVANQPSRCLFIAHLDSDSAQESKGLHVAVEAMEQYNKQLENTGSKAGAVFAVRGFKDSAACDEFIKATRPRLNKISIEPKAFNADEEAVKSEMEAADVFLMPSREEGFGLTALEALSVGTPVLCTKNSGFAEILEEIRENDKVKGEFISNWIVSPKEKEEFGRQLGTQLWSMLRTSKTREDTYKEAEELQRQWKETYSWSKMVTALLEKLRPSTD